VIDIRRCTLDLLVVHSLYYSMTYKSQRRQSRQKPQQIAHKNLRKFLISRINSWLLSPDLAVLDPVVSVWADVWG
jgi:hypothetical protein